MCAGLRDLRGFNLVLGGIKKLFMRVTEYWLNAVNIKSTECLLNAVNIKSTECLLNAVNIKSTECLLNACESDKILFSFAALFLVF